MIFTDLLILMKLIQLSSLFLLNLCESIFAGNKFQRADVYLLVESLEEGVDRHNQNEGNRKKLSESNMHPASSEEQRSLQ